MNGPSTAREALLAETLGELAQLLDRAEGIQAAMTESRRGLSDAHEKLTQQLAQVTVTIEHAKLQAVKHILVRTEEAGGRSMDARIRAIREAAQAIFRSEIEAATQRLATSLGHMMQRMEWHSRLLEFVATAAVSSALTWLIAAWLRPC